MIGYAASPILAGEWVDEARIRMPDAPALDKLEIATAVPAPLPPLEGYTFEGYRNADGSVGTKNILGIATTVQCVAGTLEYAVKRIRAELLPQYPNVDDVVAGDPRLWLRRGDHRARCAMVPIRTLQNIALNPNFGGEVMVVGLGCEKLAPERLRARGYCRRCASCACRTKRSTASAPSSNAIMAHGRRAACGAQPAPPRNLPGLRSGGRPAMRRQRRFLRRHRQSRRGLRRRSAGARRRDRDVLRSHRSARRDPAADAPRHQRRTSAAR